MATIDDFIATVKTQGMMRSNRYTVTMGDVVNDPDNLRQIMMYCSDVQLPGVNISTAQLRTYGELREVPYEKLFGDINLTFYVDNNMNVKNYFDRWMGLIQDPSNTILFSQVSLFEIAIKQNIGKLPDLSVTTNDIYDQALSDNFSFLQIHNKHLHSYQKIPLLQNHRDPFDRLLLAVALEEDAIILTVDKNFKLYPNIVKVLW